jgi:hypothetical protein
VADSTVSSLPSDANPNNDLETDVFAYRRTALHKRVIVNLADKAFAGILWARRGSLLVLRDAELFQPGAEPARLDGEVVIERSRVEFIQIPAPG